MLRKFNTLLIGMSTKNKRNTHKKSKNPIGQLDSNKLSSPVVPVGPVTIDKKSGKISIKFLAKPGAKQNGITDISNDGVGVQISAPPVEGEANTELIKYLSKLFNIRKSDISLDKGSKSRDKTILISNDGLTVESIIDILKSESTL